MTVHPVIDKTTPASFHRKPSRTELAFSSVLDKLTGNRRLGGSHQVDSSSWQFLNTVGGEEEEKKIPEEGFRSSRDSVYESEYDR